MNGERPSNRRAAMTILAVVALVAIPLVIKQFPREVARWYHAAAIENRLDGRSDQAYRRLDAAISWDPRDPGLIVQRATWLREDERLEEALALCDAALEKNPDFLAARAERSQILQHLGRLSDAVQDWKAIARVNEQSSILPDVLIWNALAYARAVANVELAEALADAERAVARVPGNSALLDTRGFVYYRLGRDAEAKRDLDQAVALAEAQRAPLPAELPRNRPSSIDPREWSLELKRVDNELAVIVYHRSLVLQRLGDEQGAEADRARVRQLGFTPDDRLF